MAENKKNSKMKFYAAVLAAVCVVILGYVMTREAPPSQKAAMPANSSVSDKSLKQKEAEMKEAEGQFVESEEEIKARRDAFGNIKLKKSSGGY